MNKRDKERFRDLQINHKFNLVHMLQCINQPYLSGLYLKNFYNVVKKYRLVLPESVIGEDNIFCSNCGSVHIAGFNLEMNMSEKSNKIGMVNKVLTFSCSHCDYTSDIIIENSACKNKNANKKLLTSISKEEGENLNKVNKNSSAKERAKKRRKNTLANILSTIKQNDEKKVNNTLNLMDFIQI